MPSKLLRKKPLLRAAAIGGGAYSALSHLRQRRTAAGLQAPAHIPRRDPPESDQSSRPTTRPAQS